MAEAIIIEESALAAIRRVGGDDLLRQMIELFLTAAPGRMTAIADALASGDLDALSRAAHALKSSAGNFGAVQLGALAGRIERDAADGKGEELPSLVQGLQAACEAVRARLEQEAPPATD